mgnify:CR=1 FL=1
MVSLLSVVPLKIGGNVSENAVYCKNTNTFTGPRTSSFYYTFEHQINTLNGNEALSEKQFAQAKQNITETLLRGIGALHGSTGRPA